MYGRYEEISAVAIGHGPPCHALRPPAAFPLKAGVSEAKTAHSAICTNASHACSTVSALTPNQCTVVCCSLQLIKCIHSPCYSRSILLFRGVTNTAPPSEGSKAPHRPSVRHQRTRVTPAPLLARRRKGTTGHSTTYHALGHILLLPLHCILPPTHLRSTTLQPARCAPSFSPPAHLCHRPCPLASPPIRPPLTHTAIFILMVACGV